MPKLNLSSVEVLEGNVLLKVFFIDPVIKCNKNKVGERDVNEGLELKYNELKPLPSSLLPSLLGVSLGLTTVCGVTFLRSNPWLCTE